MGATESSKRDVQFINLQQPLNEGLTQIEAKCFLNVV